jgi:hypothetical protein
VSSTDIERIETYVDQMSAADSMAGSISRTHAFKSLNKASGKAITRNVVRFIL